MAIASTRPEQAERDREILGEGGGGCRDAGEIGGDGDAYGHSPIADRQEDPRSATSTWAVAGPGRLVVMNFARRRFVGGQRQGRIPQGARAQQLAAIVRHLPVKSRQRIGEARIGGRPRHDQVPSWSTSIPASNCLR